MGPALAAFMAHNKWKKTVMITSTDDVWFDSGAMPYAQFHFMGDDPSEGTQNEGGLSDGDLNDFKDVTMTAKSHASHNLNIPNE